MVVLCSDDGCRLIGLNIEYLFIQFYFLTFEGREYIESFVFRQNLFGVVEIELNILSVHLVEGLQLICEHVPFLN